MRLDHNLPNGIFLFPNRRSDMSQHRHEHRNNTPASGDFTTLSEVFKLLADPTRLQIFWTLCHRSQCVMDLAGMLDISSPAISHHLKLLKEGGIVISRREGKEVYYTAADTEAVETLHHAVEEIIQVSCPERKQALCSHFACESLELTQQEQVFRQVHNYLVENLHQRITIEALGRQFLMNTTTLKDGFKALYGTSIAAHIKEHRMEKAAWLLQEGELPVSQVARQVGYASQSKFSAVFCKQYGVSPLEYRKNAKKK
jgi:AraC-like DNA-binding protein/biotin operon repressor